ncbi:MAG: hypothetical protein PVH19_03675 [Planctomycetia bacterium]|jgi:hypothetical protein
MLDAYHLWLGIPPSEQPPDAYRLLGLSLFESNPEVIRIAADRQTTHLRMFQLGEHATLSQKLLNEVATARVTLLNPEKKAVYDRQLADSLGMENVKPGQRVPIGGHPVEPLDSLFDDPLADETAVKGDVILSRRALKRWVRWRRTIGPFIWPVIMVLLMGTAIYMTFLVIQKAVK